MQVKYGEKVAFLGDIHRMDIRGLCSLLDLLKERGASTVFQLGDFGYDFPQKWVDSLNEKLIDRDMQIYFVDGNHDNHKCIHKLFDDDPYSNLHYLQRGFSFMLGKKKVLCIGGGYSVDKAYREEGKSWWATEDLSDEDLELIKSQEGIDIIIAHDAPQFSNSLKGSHKLSLPHHIELESEKRRTICGDICDIITPKMWIHAHYHVRYSQHCERNCAPQPYTVQFEGLSNADWEFTNAYFIYDPKTEEFSHNEVRFQR